MHAHPMICRGCGEYAEIPGGCECDDEPSDMEQELADLRAELDEGRISFLAYTIRRDNLIDFYGVA